MPRVSIRGVAQRAGVSTMTVSRVMRGEGDSQFYEQVMAAVRELDYVPVRSALQNKHIKTNTIGVLLDGEFVFDSLVGFQTFAGITKMAFAKGYDLVMLQPKHHLSLDEQKKQVLDRRCDGFIFVVPYESPEVLQLLVKSEFPAVTCYSTDVPAGIGCVVPDNEAAVRTAVELLHSKGHRKIAFWSGGTDHSDARERAEAYQTTMQEFGLDADTFTFGYSLADMNADNLNTLMARQTTAIICHNDERALALWDVAVEQGMQIPDDLSIIGIDDIDEAARRGLTTLVNPFRSIGEEAVNTILSRLEGDEVPSSCKRVTMSLIERASVAFPKGVQANS